MDKVAQIQMITTAPAFAEWEKEMDKAIQWPKSTKRWLTVAAMVTALFMSIQLFWLGGTAAYDTQYSGILGLFLMAMVLDWSYWNQRRKAMYRLKAMVEDNIKEYTQMSEELPNRIEQELTEVLGQHGIVMERAPEPQETLN